MSDYPKTLYRAGTGIGHMLGDKPLKVENKHLCDLLRVEDEDTELAALDDGWHPTAEAACAPKAKEPEATAPKPEPKATEKTS